MINVSLIKGVLAQKGYRVTPLNSITNSNRIMILGLDVAKTEKLLENVVATKTVTSDDFDQSDTIATVYNLMAGRDAKRVVSKVLKEAKDDSSFGLYANHVRRQDVFLFKCDNTIIVAEDFGELPFTAALQMPVLSVETVSV